MRTGNLNHSSFYIIHPSISITAIALLALRDNIAGNKGFIGIPMGFLQNGLCGRPLKMRPALLGAAGSATIAVPRFDFLPVVRLGDSMAFFKSRVRLLQSIQLIKTSLDIQHDIVSAARNNPPPCLRSEMTRLLYVVCIRVITPDKFCQLFL